VRNPSLTLVCANNAVDGLPSIVEILRVLVNVLDPNDHQHTDSTRLTALGVLNAAFEAAGTRIAEFPSLKAIIVDPGCKFLFQLARSENSNVLQWSLRTISTILDTMRKHLKLQQELYLTFTIDRLTPPQVPPVKGPSIATPKPRGVSPSPHLGTPASNSSPLLLPVDKSESESTSPPSRLLVPPAKGETRDFILETLGQIAGHASFMVDLYTNYDCDPNCENLFERLVDFLTKVRFSMPLVRIESYDRLRQCILHREWAILKFNGMYSTSVLSSYSLLSTTWHRVHWMFVFLLLEY